MFKIQLLNSNALTKHLYKNNVNISTVLNRSFKRSTFLRRKMQKHNHIRMAEIYPRVCNWLTGWGIYMAWLSRDWTTHYDSINCNCMNTVGKGVSVAEDCSNATFLHIGVNEPVDRHNILFFSGPTLCNIPIYLLITFKLSMIFITLSKIHSFSLL